MKTKGTGRGIKKNKTERKRKTFKRAYLSKTQAARRLQVTNAEFERLAILKGIYPREPKRFEGSNGKDKTYYFSKDILWLEREPLLEKLRDFGTFKKKLARLRGRREEFDAKLFEQQHKPQYSLTTILKERYPTFTDALRDCDDALTHIFLYAALPPRVHSETTIESHTHLTSAMSDQCKEIRARWLSYINKSHSIRKVFISIKGIYYQAKVKGETVTWQCPYEFTSKPPKDVIYRIMITFLELYIQQMKFILFKLEHDQNLELERAALKEDEANETTQAEDFPETQEEQEKKLKTENLQKLFQGLKFYVSREVPQMHMRFIVESFNGTIADRPDAEGLTHYIIDRPSVPPGETQRPGVDYVQPQWLFDCINAKGLLPADEYLMGKDLPAHISPFRISISNDKDEITEIKEAVKLDRRILEDDVPDRVHEIRRMLDPSYNMSNPTADVALSDEDDDELDDQDHQEVADESLEEESVEPDTDEDRVREHIERSKQSKKRLQKQLEKGDNKPTQNDAASKKRKQIQELREKRDSEPIEKRKKRKLEEAKAKEQADKEMKMAVMENKPRKLYKAMQHGIKQRTKQLSNLEERRELIREGKAKLDPKTRTLKL
eukprot:TRINITY_DN2724_c0_g1_i1.p1 TRINITY_DN2724_c0_g1~~TRINITY_DN2724_c0_g1_i1.p1  ORF type:complete len:634 (+),score=345.50 TRINITY_DN2724_c0_g1_i1:77-1903(+)